VQLIDRSQAAAGAFTNARLKLAAAQKRVRPKSTTAVLLGAQRHLQEQAALHGQSGYQYDSIGRLRSYGRQTRR
jgi:hypothetical protein